MADITISEVRELITLNLGDESDILAVEHRAVENKILDYVVQELAKITKTKVLLLETFTTDRNYSISTGLPVGSVIESVNVMLVCKVATNDFAIDDVVTAPTPYPQDSGRTSAQGIGVQYNNVSSNVIKIVVNDQLTIMTAYNSSVGSTAGNVLISGANTANWKIKLIVGYK